MRPMGSVTGSPFLFNSPFPIMEYSSDRLWAFDPTSMAIVDMKANIGIARIETHGHVPKPPDIAAGFLMAAAPDLLRQLEIAIILIESHQRDGDSFWTDAMKVVMAKAV